MSFGNTFLAAIVAGALSAHLAGSIFGSALSGGLFFLIAPFPLLIVGFFYLPLAALAAGLIGAVLLSLLSAGANPFAYLLIIGLPAFFACWLLALRGQGGLFEASGFLNPGAVAFALTIFIAAASVIVTMMAEPDYAKYTQANRVIATQATAQFMREMPNARAAINEADLAETMTFYAPLASMLMVEAIFLFLVYLAARLARQWKRLGRPWPDFATTALPLAGLTIMAASLLLLMLNGWLSLFGGFVFVGLFMLTILTGLAVLHHRARLMPQTRWMVPAAWIAVVVLSPFMLMIPALFMAALGIADHVFDLRGLRRAPKS